MNQSQQHRIKRTSGSLGATVFLRGLQANLRAGLVAVVVASFSAGLATNPAHASESEQQVNIYNVVVNRSNIFDLDTINGNDRQPQGMRLIELGVNRFHVTTRESVILREAGVKPGDSIAVADVAEIERRLRVLGIFASVDVSLVTVAAGIELHITTRDNFSIVGGASGSFLGGVGNLGLTFGETNVLGTGNRVRVNFARSTTDDFRSSISFRDLHFFSKPWQANYALGRTDEGDSFSVKLSDSFRSLGSGREWSLTVDGVERFRKYYLNGDTVTQVPEKRVRLIAQHVWRSGLFDRFLRKGVESNVVQSDYSAINGALIDGVVQPDDTRKLYVGGLIALDKNHSFKKVQGLDTLNFVQDVRLGSIAEIKLGVNFVDNYNSQTQSRVDPSIALLLDRAFVASEHSLLRLTLNSNAVFEETGARPWSTTARLRAYDTRINNTTIAFNADYSTGEDGTGLPVQLTLGENNGLRGYDIRQFQGRQRLRTNLEVRYHSGWRLGFLDVGLIGFADAGWAALKGDTSASLNRSIGAGLRLASNALLGSRVIRIDLAVPLDPPVGGSSDPVLSAAVGQVFRF